MTTPTIAGRSFFFGKVPCLTSSAPTGSILKGLKTADNRWRSNKSSHPHPIKADHCFGSKSAFQVCSSSGLYHPSFLWLLVKKQKTFLSVQEQKRSANWIFVPLQGRAWANDSIGGLAAGHKSNITHTFLYADHLDSRIVRSSILGFWLTDLNEQNTLQA